MSLPADIPQNINIQPIPVEKIVQIPKPEPGKNDVNYSAFNMKDQREGKDKRVESRDDQSKKKRDRFEKSGSGSKEEKDQNVSDEQKQLILLKSKSNISYDLGKGQLLDITG